MIDYREKRLAYSSSDVFPNTAVHRATEHIRHKVCHLHTPLSEITSPRRTVPLEMDTHIF